MAIGPLRMLFVYLREKGIELQPLLAELGMGLPELSLSSLRVSQEQRALAWTRATALTGDADLPLHVAAAIPWPLVLAMGREFPLANLFLVSESLGVGLERWSHFLPCVDEAMRLSLETDGERCALRCWLPGAPDVAAFQLAMMLSAIRFATRDSVRPLALRLSFSSPGKRAAWLGLLGVAPRFGAGEDVAVFAKDAARARLCTADEAVFREAETHAQELLGRLGRGRSTLSRARAALERSLAEGPARASQIARELGLSERTFLRHLADSDTSYRKLLDEVRAGIAKRLLFENLPTAEIASRLGFTETSAFRRAFRRWFGEPVSRARAR